MGLRIRSNMDAVRSLTALNEIERAQSRASERAASQKRMNSAADDPGAVGTLQAYKTEFARLVQSATNAQTAINLLTTVDNALATIQTSITNIQAAIATPNQTTIDTELTNIDTVSKTTTFGGRRLLDGSSALRVTGVDNTRIADLEVRRFDFSSASADLDVELITPATRGSYEFVFGGSVGGTGLTIDVTGPLGTATGISLLSTDTAANVATKIDAQRAVTGVALNGATNTRSVDYGAAAVLTITATAGTGTMSLVDNFGTPTVGFTNGQTVTTRGTDAVVKVNGLPAAVNGLQVSAVGPHHDLRFQLQEAGTFTDTISVTAGSGVSFDLGAGTSLNQRLNLGMPSVTTGNLGRRALVSAASEEFFGFLSSLRTGGANAVATDPDNAGDIATASASEVSALRSLVGAQISRLFTPLKTLFQNQDDEVEEARSALEDISSAAATAELTKQQVLFQAGLAVLAQNNLTPQTVIKLLPFPSSL